MISAPVPPEQLLDEILASYLQAVEEGGNPDPARWKSRHPELAGELDQFFADQARFARWAGPLCIGQHQETPGNRLPNTISFKPADSGIGGEAVAVHFPGYEIHGILGRGGMGLVYRAHHLRLDRPVALKVIRDAGQAGPTELSRFQNEARLAAQLQHPHIVQIFEVGEHQGQPYLALELVEGTNLARAIDGTPQPPTDAARLVETLARAMHHAHERGVIHRDLKPSNVLLQQDRNAENAEVAEKKASAISASSAFHGLPKIADFGLAKHLHADQQATETGAILGTPSYMAPEQAEGKSKQATAATDVYALGAILYELLTGRPPFRAPTPLETLLQVVHNDPVPPSSLQPKLPRDLETVCLKCLEKDASRRYTSAADLADDLCRFLAGRPVVARPISWFARAVKWARRRPAAAALIFVTTLALIGGLVGSWIYNADLSVAFAAKEKEHKRANLEGATSKAINNFLEDDLLGQASPEDHADLNQAPDRNLQLRTVLDRAAKRLDGKFREQPVVEASLRMTIGSTYRKLGELDAAGPHLEKALKIFERELGADDAKTLEALNALAVLKVDEGKTEEAERYLTRCLEEFARSRSDRMETYRAMNNLAGLFIKQKQPERAERWAIEALDGVRRRLGENSRYTFLCMITVGQVHLQAKRFDEAEAMFLEASKGFREKLGEGHPEALWALNELGVLYANQRQISKAERVFVEALEGARKVHGPKHHVTLDFLDNLAVLCLARGELSRAEKLLNEALQAGPPLAAKQDTFGLLLRLAKTYEKDKQYAKAEPVYLKLFEAQEKVWTIPDVRLQETVTAIVNCYDAWGKKAQAADWRKKLVGKQPERTQQQER